MGGGWALLGYAHWLDTYGEESDPIGEVLTIDGSPHEVVGILPDGFEFFFANQDIWVPLQESPQSSERDERTLFAIGRMAVGSTMDQVRTEMTSLFERLAAEQPETLKGWTVDSYNLRYDIPTGQTRLLFALLQGCVFLVLVIACVNVTNLLLARGQQRSREIALRTVLGAGRMRIVRQLLTESFLMVAASGVIGTALGAVGIRLMSNQFAGTLPAQFELALDWRVLMFTGGLALLSGLLFGLAPALQSFKQNHTESLKDGGRGGQGASKKMLSKILVVGEIALSFVALGGGSLLVRSFLDLRASDPGFEVDGILTALVTVPDSKYPDAEQKSVLTDRILDQVRGLSGVTATTLTNSLPQNFQAPTDSFVIASAVTDGVLTAPRAMTLKAGPEYLETLGVALLQGRFFDAGDRVGSAPVIAVSRTLAERCFEGSSPLGERAHVDGQSREIVGVIEDVNHVAFQSAIQTDEAIYLPVAQEPEGAQWIMLRTSGNAQTTKEPLRTAVEQIDADLSLSQMLTMEEFTAQFFVGINVFNTVLSGFGLMALLLAALGTYGVMAYSVSQRSHEIGIRMAVGARPREVVRMIARQGITLGIVGLVLGGLMTLPLIGLLNSLLQGLTTVKPLTLVSIASVLFAVTVIASLVPASHAASVDPVRTLRDE